MKEVFAYYAKCNDQVNREMLSIIDGKIEDPYAHELKGYYFKSLGLLLEHVYVSDMNWMKEFSGINDCGMRIEDEVGMMPENGKQMFSNYDEYKKQRVRLDAFIIKYMGRIEEGDLGKSVSRMTRKSGKIERALWKALIHFFNHQTHHRGQISNILDELNIENNYSNMIFIE